MNKLAGFGGDIETSYLIGSNKKCCLKTDVDYQQAKAWNSYVKIAQQNVHFNDTTGMTIKPKY